MSKLSVVEPLVKQILEDDPAARDDDFYLIASVYYKLVPGIANMPFSAVMLGHKQLKIPAQASITRSKRKLQAKYPELRPSEHIQEIRSKEESEYIDYAIDGYTNTFTKFVDSQK